MIKKSSAVLSHFYRDHRIRIAPPKLNKLRTKGTADIVTSLPLWSSFAGALNFTLMATIPDTALNGTHHCIDSYRYGSFSFANEEEDPYFVTNAKPDGLDIVKRKADEFIKFQCAKKRPVVLVTSGGSTVPLEVRSPGFVVSLIEVESNSAVYR
jgi:hypothetical protein